MDRKPEDDRAAIPDAPALAEQDWDALENEELEPETVIANGDLRFEEAEGELTEEDDDNPYQESDEALPEDKEEAAIRRELPSRPN